MAPKSWDVGHELQALRERMSRLFEEELPRQGRGSTGAFSPATDVYLTEQAVVVTMELPGVDPARVAIHCEEQVLTVSGERPPSGDGACLQIERKSGPFLRSLLLPPGVRTAERRVRFEDGLLTVELPRDPEL
ncbi:MAG: Hsp20/alpha crystallin family protein [Myxococcales bacterium]|nr:Hsp20/alpha crystallin family protein [Myxococcota bacterium]MDW8281249.1 Hsp20/alpha crystallin family protein [Myxococcales bacterium]